MLKTSSTESAKPRKDGDRVGGDSRAKRGRSEIDRIGIDDVEVNGGEVEIDEIGKVQQSSKNSSKSKKTVRSSDFFTPRAKLAFTKLRQAFHKAPILHHFDPECYIRIETDESGYATSEVFNQLTLDNLGRWHSVTFFSRKMILAETRYETHDGELLAIVEVFKTWRHYLEGSQHKMLVLTDHNNLCRFIDMKSLSSRQVRWAQKLSRYHFRIDYHQGKANRTANALSRYPQQSAEEEKILRTENVKILHHLQSLLTKVSGLSVNTSHLSPLHQVLICKTTVLPQLYQFWNSLQGEIAWDSPYIANIGGMRLQLPKLQDKDKETKALRVADLSEDWKNVKGVLPYQGLAYVPEIFRS